MAPTTRSQSKRVHPDTLVKILNANRIHNGFVYKEGLNVCTQPWNDIECYHGGLYACPLRHLFAWLPHFLDAASVAWVYVPQGAHRASYPTKIKASRLVLIGGMTLADAVAHALPLANLNDVSPHDMFAWAAICGHADIVRMLVDAGWDIHSAGNSALARAEQSGSAAAVRILLDAGVFSQVSINWVFRNASMSCHEDCMRLLLSRGADVDYDNGWALASAAVRGNKDCIRLLLDAGAATYDQALMDVCMSRYGSTHCARMLLDAGARVSPEMIAAAHANNLGACADLLSTY